MARDGKCPECRAPLESFWVNDTRPRFTCGKCKTSFDSTDCFPDGMLLKMSESFGEKRESFLEAEGFAHQSPEPKHTCFFVYAASVLTLVVCFIWARISGFSWGRQPVLFGVAFVGALLAKFEKKPEWVRKER